ncbi:hypothetical protein C7S18_22460 [Ahniella affigens]|uniref:Uncharacterized protein n=1 Tax=Ahniella affigens TaxID=2021234 RepID=A0A2P1PY52_9GAMM|nr:hypothetical protein [Ahniella affigens]AVP99766.1 hypothetical protein C7S18_22460 [Ahniella affigens]
MIKLALEVFRYDALPQNPPRLWVARANMMNDAMFDQREFGVIDQILIEIPIPVFAFDSSIFIFVREIHGANNDRQFLPLAIVACESATLGTVGPKQFELALGLGRKGLPPSCGGTVEGKELACMLIRWHLDQP